MTRNKPKVTSEEVRQLVVARLRQLSPKKGISIGSDRFYTKRELIKEVEGNTKIGRKMIKIEMEFLRSLKKLTYVPQKIAHH